MFPGQPHLGQHVHQQSAETQTGKHNPFFSRVRAQPVNGEAETEEHGRNRPHQLPVFEAVEGLAFVHHHIHLPQSRAAHRKNARRQEKQSEQFFIHLDRPSEKTKA